MGRALGKERGALGHLDNPAEISSVTEQDRQGRFLPEAGGGMFWEAGHLSCHHLWKGGTESGCESKGALGFRRESLSAHGIFSGCEFRLPDPHRSWFGVESSLRRALGPLPGPIQEGCGGENMMLAWLFLQGTRQGFWKWQSAGFLVHPLPSSGSRSILFIN